MRGSDMPQYRFLLSDASNGANYGELPLTLDSPYTRLENGIGQLSGSIPRNHPLAAFDVLQGDREITVWRDGDVDWNGPITNLPNATLDGPTVSLVAREASWYMSKRTLEQDKTYTAQDVFDILRDLVGDYMVNKTSDGTTSGGTSINAAIPRFFVAPAAGTTAGITRTFQYFGAGRHLIADIFDQVIATDVDYRMDYATGSSRQQCYRTLTLGAPLGSAHNELLSEYVLAQFTKSQDRERAATRVHVTGSGTPYTAQNTGSIADGDILLESVVDRSDLVGSAVTSFGDDLRRRSQPPISTIQFSYQPRDVGPFPFGFCNLGDTIDMNVGGTTILHSTGHLRVVQIDVMPPQGGAPELVTCTLNIPLDELGT